MRTYFRSQFAGLLSLKSPPPVLSLCWAPIPSPARGWRRRQTTLSTGCLFLSLSLLLCLPLSAQDFDNGFYWGVLGGATYSSIEDIRTTIISDIYPEDTYTTSPQRFYGGQAGIFFQYRFEDNSHVALRLEFAYAQQRGGMSYSDIQGLEYELGFNYEYFNISPLLKVNTPLKPLYVIGGLTWGINLAGEKIGYRSNQSETVPDLQIQESLREVLKGQSNFGATVGLGIELVRDRLALEGRYTYGFKDVIETLANSYYFIENKNPSHFFQATLSYSIPFDESYRVARQ